MKLYKSALLRVTFLNQGCNFKIMTLLNLQNLASKYWFPAILSVDSNIKGLNVQVLVKGRLSGGSLKKYLTQSVAERLSLTPFDTWYSPNLGQFNQVVTSIKFLLWSIFRLEYLLTNRMLNHQPTKNWHNMRHFSKRFVGYEHLS